MNAIFEPPARQAQDARGLVMKLERRLREAGISASRPEAEWLVADSLGLRRTEVYLREGLLPPESLELIVARAARRVQGEPLQYVLGSCEFYGHRLSVGPGVFIPRPETEVLVEEAIRALQWRAARGDQHPLRILELGAGTGAVAISLAKAVPTCIVVAVELSWMALQVARTNVITHRVEPRLRIVQADWTAGIRGPFDMIVSNPPYVLDEEVRFLNGRTGDPAMSLNGGRDGMTFHRRLLADAGQLLSTGGALLMECAEGQALPLQQMGRALPWVKTARIYEDLAGRPRGLFIDT